jgi:hypothetical protein
MTHANKIWVKMKDKCYSTNMKPNNISDKLSVSQTMKNMEKCFIWVGFGPLPQGGEDPTLTNIDGWLDLKVYKVK